MTQEELKNTILTHVSLDEYRKAEIEHFFSECKGITLENYKEKFQEWKESKSGKDALAQIEKDLSNKQDDSIQKGLTAIQRNDYSVLEDTICLGTYIVKNRETGYYGLITESGEEILPCIFSTVSVKSYDFIEVGFKGVYMNPTHNLKLCERKAAVAFAEHKKNGFIYGDKGGYFILGLRREIDERTKQLIDLLNINHSALKE